MSSVFAKYPLTDAFTGNLVALSTRIVWFVSTAEQAIMFRAQLRSPLLVAVQVRTRIMPFNEQTREVEGAMVGVPFIGGFRETMEPMLPCESVMLIVE